ncbi:hypothetical protein D3878_01510 [Noviherbaspirillum sedimenti]|uniref:Uncharacterized protein n=1 Tax=Noviherbaspirillum sedimenti TaxID=2320865 RepID=A0A3A3FW86_9BURK|nr:hypothetical protein D3878_01510 [Noviherbaspirillum sedimenti]
MLIELRRQSIGPKSRDGSYKCVIALAFLHPKQIMPCSKTNFIHRTVGEITLLRRPFAIFGKIRLFFIHHMHSPMPAIPGIGKDSRLSLSL